jgi:hypothetical protein
MLILRLFIFTGALSLFWRYYQTATDANFIVIVLWAMLLFVLPAQLYYGWQREFSLVHFKQPFSRPAIKVWLTILNRLSFIFIAGWAGKLAMVQWQFTEAEFYQEQVEFLLLLAILVMLAFWVRTKMDVLFNLLIFIMTGILGLEVYQANVQPDLSDSVVLQSPYEGSFYIADGGNSRLTSTMKVGGRANRKYAIYMIATDQAFKPEEMLANGYWANFDANILAPAAGRVIQIQDGNPDVGPDDFIGDSGPGNYILVQIADERYVMLAHLKRGSFQVTEGEHVEAGQVIAQAGKSGSVTLSATFLAVYASADIFTSSNKTYPIYFDQVRDLTQPRKFGPFFAVRNDMFAPIESQ